MAAPAAVLTLHQLLLPVITSHAAAVWLSLLQASVLTAGWLYHCRRVSQAALSGSLSQQHGGGGKDPAEALQV